MEIERMKKKNHICLVFLFFVFAVCLAVLYFKVKNRALKHNADGVLQVTIPRNEGYDRDVERIRSELVEDDALESVFGTGDVDIQHYQEAFDDPAFLWSGFFAGKYATFQSAGLFEGHFKAPGFLKVALQPQGISGMDGGNPCLRAACSTPSRRSSLRPTKHPAAC
jgi:hypothetical protein